jgi:2-keto-4-pentenoate hydratase/2-oxohepta-3-ene-1,7-dioic acid hydratase in catechol pathway
MKLVTLNAKSSVSALPYGRLGRVENDHVIPFDFPNGMLGLIQTGQEGLAVAAAAIGQAIPFDDAGVLAPVLCPSKIVAVGKNYIEHAQETKAAVPDHPIIFTKFTTAIIGARDAVTWDPALTGRVDFEAELAVVIGKTARRVPQAEALDYVFGYTCANDISARDLQYGDGQWVRGKSLDTFCPLGPWLVTADELPDPQRLGIRCLLNGQTMQDSNTGRMIFSVAYLVSFLSHAFTLLPGDIILTGTPDGVGAFREPPVYLKDGDEIVVEIDGVGRLVNYCRVE